MRFHLFQEEKKALMEVKRINMERVFGYARVSSKDQSLARQIDALAEFPVEPSMIFKDKESGKDFNRPQYQKLIRKLKKGDVLVVKSIDRLGRNYREILEEWRKITHEKEAAIVVLDMPLLDTRAPANGLTGEFLADVVLSLLSYIAQIERENIKQRQAEGIAAARARGVKFGRPRKEKPSNYIEIRDGYLSGRIGRKDAVKELGIGTTTLDRWIKEELERKPLVSN